VIAVVVVALLGGSGAYALHRYDESRSDLIAEGVRVAGIDVGGLTVADARAALRREIGERLDMPLTLRHGKRRFVVEPQLVDVSTNVDAALRSALAESREGNVFTRSFRDLTGRELDRELALRVDYSRDAVRRVVDGIRRALDRPAREAKADVSLDGVRITRSETGIAVRTRALRDAFVGRLARPETSRAFPVPARTLKPKVTTAELTRRYRYFIAVNRGQRTLRFYVGFKLRKAYRVGIGRIGFETDAGLYEIKTKAADPAWYVPDRPWAGDLAGKVIPAGDPRNPIKARWMGFWDGAGIHGTADVASIGTAASHGCIRMVPRDVIDLYDRVPLGTPLYIS
jgi:L,D-transpeptidase catalytic domain/Putative peptidoglycan binding domain